jgi:AraC-like DNA-binding protein
MRARFENIVPATDRSFRVEERRIARFDAPWHFHPEVELTYIVASSGRRFVGDSIEPFAAGDLVLLGPNLPHFWHNEGRRRKTERAHSIVVQFRPDFLGGAFLEKPELAPVRRLLVRAQRGLAFSSARLAPAVARLRALPRLHGIEALASLLQILGLLAAAQARPLATGAEAPQLDLKAESRLSRAYAFMLARFRDPIRLEEIARAAAMSPAAFSRFFKRSTRRNVSTVLNELRVGHAARLLQETDRSVAVIALESGFPTLSNFNRRFRELRRCTPTEFRRTLVRSAGSNRPAVRWPA